MSRPEASASGSLASAQSLPVQRQMQQQMQQQVRQLARRDAEVRAHEQAHASVGGAYASAPKYEYQRGPNGVNYAVGGHVEIDVAVIPGDPAATLAKMEVVRRAALAVAEPSAADRAVAAKAAAQASEARAELASRAPQSVSAPARGATDPADTGAQSAQIHNNPMDSLGARINISV